MESSLLRSIRTALAMLVILTLLTGLVYPMVVTGVAQLAFPSQANGSLVLEGNAARGSRLVGQPFTEPSYFWGRLSATSPAYNADASGGSNLGPTNPALAAAARARIAALRAADPERTAPVPVDLVTSSGSGLDPHISPAAAELQVHRVAKARGIDEARVRALVREHTQGRTLGILGEPRVDVLGLNLALDRTR